MLAQPQTQHAKQTNCTMQQLLLVPTQTGAYATAATATAQATRHCSTQCMADHKACQCQCPQPTSAGATISRAPMRASHSTTASLLEALKGGASENSGTEMYVKWPLRRVS